MNCKNSYIIEISEAKPHEIDHHYQNDEEEEKIP